MFAIVKRYFAMGIYEKEEVAMFVKAQSLSEEEYEKITGEKFEAN